MSTPKPWRAAVSRYRRVHPAQFRHGARVVEQREHGEVREIEPVLVHDLGFLAALGQVVQPRLLLRETPLPPWSPPRPVSHL